MSFVFFKKCHSLVEFLMLLFMSTYLRSESWSKPTTQISTFHWMGKKCLHGPGLGFRWAIVQWHVTMWMRCPLQLVMFISYESSLTLWIFSSYHDFYDLYISLTSMLKCKCWISIELEAKAKSMCMYHEHSQRSISWWCCCNKPKNI